MQIDLESGHAARTHHSDICILGAGVAGLVLATRLAQRGLRVHLVEAGGLTLEPRSQALYTAAMAGDPHTGASEGRFRVFGGSSTRWGGQLLPYTADVFEPAPGTPSAAWPISPPALEPFYPEVLRLMGLPPRAAALPWDGDPLLHALGHPAVPLGGSVRLRYSKWASFRRRNLAHSLGRACLSSPNATVFLHANAVQIEASGGRATGVRVRNYSGGEFHFRAPQIIVCLGTIESARLLLASGLGSDHNQVGRYFHDHVGCRVAEIEGSARAQILHRLGPFFVDGVLHTCKLEASPVLRGEQSLPAVMAHVVIEEPGDSGVAAVRGVLQAMQRGKPRAVASGVIPVVQGAADVARLVWASRVQRRRAVSQRARIFLHIDMEQVAPPTQCICLSTDPADLDSLGIPRVVIHWHAGAPERALARSYAPVVRDSLLQAGFAPLRWLPGALEGDPAALELHDTYHPMGGLRMGGDPASSVVSADLAVHGLPNLHVASCATFPSGGSSNPTFTLMALALRLADHLAP